MSRLRAPWWLCLGLFLSALFLGCGGSGSGGGAETSKTTKTADVSASPSGTGVCGLLMQAEVDEIFGTSIGAGASESLEDGSQLCSWPANEDAALLLQVGPLVKNLTEAVALGEGYRVSELQGMTRPAAIAIQEATSKTKAQVAVVALNASDKTVILSPIGLGVVEGTDRFERLKSLMELVAKRL